MCFDVAALTGLYVNNMCKVVFWSSVYSIKKMCSLVHVGFTGAMRHKAADHVPEVKANIATSRVT